MVRRRQVYGEVLHTTSTWLILGNLLLSCLCPNPRLHPQAFRSESLVSTESRQGIYQSTGPFAGYRPGELRGYLHCLVQRSCPFYYCAPQHPPSLFPFWPSTTTTTVVATAVVSRAKRHVLCSNCCLEIHHLLWQEKRTLKQRIGAERANKSSNHRSAGLFLTYSCVWYTCQKGEVLPRVQDPPKSGQYFVESTHLL